ncbi:unnamed protein product [Cylindrotheca closterium]|uniref:Pyridoxamine 5'-phosphate oxidase N-terminal domain-containing protein n=1 Tax=Cylindrotheca closterium TaxID=2856 RepID=A0AAD2FKE7_9STRA|nr:unnamed protein product [Cylindrotheca closterium]
MGKLLDSICEHDVEFMAKQKVFFVATAPLSPHHRVNVSPKAPGTSLVVLNPHKVAYLDLTGSGSETASHLSENGRITILFCHLEEGPPRLMRLHGKARILLKEEADAELLSKFPSSLTSHPGFRAIYVMDVDRISSSCGYSMPIFSFDRYRTKLDDWTKNKGSEGMAEYGLTKNSFSIDGIPSLAVLKAQKDGNPYRINPKPTDGYIYGEKVSMNRLLSHVLGMQHGIRQKLFVENYGPLMFLCGMFTAYALQWIMMSSQQFSMDGVNEL